MAADAQTLHRLRRTPLPVPAVRERWAVCPVSSKRKRPPMETPEYSRSLERQIVAYGKRCAEGDDVDLGRMLEVRAALDEAIGHAVRSQAERNSWAYVAAGLRMTREGAWKRFRRASLAA